MVFGRIGNVQRSLVNVTIEDSEEEGGMDVDILLRMILAKQNEIKTDRIAKMKEKEKRRIG